MPNTSADWRPSAAAFLHANTRASGQIIAHFIDIFWQPEASDEENLARFETYRAEFNCVYSY